MRWEWFFGGRGEVRFQAGEEGFNTHLRESGTPVTDQGDERVRGEACYEHGVVVVEVMRVVDVDEGVEARGSGSGGVGEVVDGGGGAGVGGEVCVVRLLEFLSGGEECN